MDTTLIFLSFCLTLVALTALGKNKDKIAEKAIHTLGKLHLNLGEMFIKREDSTEQQV